MHAGDTWNVLPQHAMLRGTARSFKPAVQDAMESAIRETRRGCRGSDIDAAPTFAMSGAIRRPSTIQKRPVARRERRRWWSARRASETDPTPSMGSEDFAFMLRERPGCYVWLGNGPIEAGRVLHNAWL